jgi:hypothetical protein
MDDARVLVLQALDRAVDALDDAAADLTVAAVLAPHRGALMSDALVLAEAVEAERAAVLATLLRHG